MVGESVSIPLCRFTIPFWVCGGDLSPAQAIVFPGVGSAPMPMGPGMEPLRAAGGIITDGESSRSGADIAAGGFVGRTEQEAGRGRP